MDKTRAEQETHRGVLRAIEKSFGPTREQDGAITQRHMDVAAALQAVLQEATLHLLRTFRSKTRIDSLCLAGGVALNCTLNGVIRRSRLFSRIFVQPAAGDDGTALGAAIYVHRQRSETPTRFRMTLPLWGPEYDDQAILEYIEDFPSCRWKAFDSTGEQDRDAAQRIASGQVLGWFQGRMEFGPRALGSRSILANPQDPEITDRLNRLVKLA